MDQEKIILGIDPGTMVMGYGVIREQGKKMELITMGVINLKKLAREQLSTRLCSAAPRVLLLTTTF